MIFVIIASAAYLIALCLQWRMTRQSTAFVRRTWIVPAIIAVCAHALYHIHATLQANGHTDMHFFAALSLTALGMTVMTTLFEDARQATVLGIIVFPLTTLFLVLCAIHGIKPSIHALGWRLSIHAWLALLAYATLSIAAILAVMLWLQENALRQRVVRQWLYVLPPLTEVETLLFRTIHAGFLLLTLTLITGLVFVNNLFTQQLLPKTMLSVLSWVLFGALLLGRWRYGWRGMKAIHLTLVAMFLLLLSFFGTQLFFEHLPGI